MISFDSKIPSCNHAITLVPSLEIAVDKIDTNSSTTSNVLLARSSVVMTHFRVIGLVILAFNWSWCLQAWLVDTSQNFPLIDIHAGLVCSVTQLSANQHLDLGSICRKLNPTKSLLSLGTWQCLLATGNSLECRPNRVRGFMWQRQWKPSKYSHQCYIPVPASASWSHFLNAF